MAERRDSIAELERRYHRDGAAVLEELRRAHDHAGRLTRQDVDRVASELGLPRSHVHGAASYYADFDERPESGVRLCAGTACFAATGGAHGEATERELGAVDHVHCLGYCYGSPAALVDGEPCAGPDLVEQLTGRSERHDPPIPYTSAVEEPIVLSRLLTGEPAAWSVWPEVLAGGGRAKVLDEVKRSGLRGRGGAGFPASVKWTSAAESPSDGPRYMIANGDEGDPGSFVDRLLMESDPHGILEGMALAALGAGASQGWVYIRSEYPRAREAVRLAVEEARRGGHLGENLHGSGFDFDVEVFEGAGSYVAGEETSLIHSMEGVRGAAAPRPPFPSTRGLYERPTVVNNVETLAAVPWIVGRGGDAYARLGTERSRGTMVVCLNATFARPGAYEVELGTSVGWICDELGGGLHGGRELRALQVGGPLGGFLGPNELDVPLSFEDLAGAGVDLGHGSLVAFDDRVDPAKLLVHVWRFIAEESCGTCFPCRVGSRRGLELAERSAAGEASRDDLTRLDALLDAMGHGSLCAFGRGAPEPVRTLMRVFPELREAAG